MLSVAETIKHISLDHIENNGVILGQCLTAVGWVGGTIPELDSHPNIIELSMADVAGGGIAVGFALANKRPIYVVRYQGFLWYNLISIANYAAKSKYMWETPCPMFVRAISMEGSIGPVAGSSHIALAYRMPGIRISCPMTPNEYTLVWDDFMKNNDPYVCSEHRKSFMVKEETPPIIFDNPDIVLICISATRFEALKAIKHFPNLKISFLPLVWIKPMKDLELLKSQVAAAKFGSIILDNDYADGIAKSIAFDLGSSCIKILGLEDRSSGFSKETDNLPPDELKIVEAINGLINCV